MNDSIRELTASPGTPLKEIRSHLKTTLREIISGKLHDDDYDDYGGLLEKMRDSPLVLDGLAKLYRRHIEFVGPEGWLRVEMAFAEVEYVLADSYSMFLENMAILFSVFITMPTPKMTRTESMSELKSQIGRVKAVLKPIKAQSRLVPDATLLSLFFPNYFSEPKGVPKLKDDITKLGPIKLSTLLEMYLDSLESDYKGLRKSPAESNQSGYRKAKIRAFQYITRELTELTGKPCPSIAVNIIQGLFDEDLGYRFASRYSYKEI